MRRKERGVAGNVILESRFRLSQPRNIWWHFTTLSDPKQEKTFSMCPSFAKLLFISLNPNFFGRDSLHGLVDFCLSQLASVSL